MRGHYNHHEAMEKIANDVKNSAYEIIAKKHATYYGIAMSVKRICEAIVRDEKSIMPISSMMHGEYGIEDVAPAIPTSIIAETTSGTNSSNVASSILKRGASTHSFLYIFKYIQILFIRF